MADGSSWRRHRKIIYVHHRHHFYLRAGNGGNHGVFNLDMIEQIQKIWPVMCGSQGWFAALLAWRGALEIVVPLINTKLQSKFTELLMASPTVANNIVQKKWYQTTALTLRMTIGILLPTESSLLVHQVKEQAQMTGDTGTFDKCEINPPEPTK